ncbi:MAG: CopG family transcriptional regulator [bacterium]
MKTLTMRVDETVYEMIKQAAKGQKRTIANFVEYATIQYLTSSQFVDNDEMEELVQDKELLANLQQGLDDVKNGDFTIV